MINAPSGPLPDISIMDWINWNRNVGTLPLLEIGLPGSGKSNFLNGLFQLRMQRGEFLVMPGDRFCEWRHFPFHPEFPTKLKILVPEDVGIYYSGFEPEETDWFETVDYNELNVLDHLSTNRRMLVVYDQHLSIAKRVWLWVKIFNQLVTRLVFIDTPIGLLFHEAGIYFDELASDDHWKGVKKFSEIFVECRRALVPCAFISQLEGEIKSTIRKKCTFQIIRKAWLSRNYPRPLRKAAPFTRIHQYHLVYGGIYTKNNTTTKFYENKKNWKMIPRVSFITGDSQADQPTTQKIPFSEAKKALELYETTQSEREVAKLLGVTRFRVRTLLEYART